MFSFLGMGRGVVCVGGVTWSSDRAWLDDMVLVVSPCRRGRRGGKMRCCAGDTAAEGVREKLGGQAVFSYQ
jgi:hypothetical protein